MAQTRSWQRKIVQGAKEQGAAGDLRWFLEMRNGRIFVPCNYPPGWVFTFPVTEDDPKREAAVVVMLMLLKSTNRLPDLRVSLTDIHELERLGLYWYDWGEDPPQHLQEREVDHVCPKCGKVHRSTILTQPWCKCQDEDLELRQLRLNELGLVEVLRSWSDGIAMSVSLR